MAKKVFSSSGGATGFTFSLTTYHAPFSSYRQPNNTAQLTEANKQVYLRVSNGVFSRMAVYSATNDLSVTGTFQFRNNGANGNQVVSVTASTTGLFQDTTNTDTVTSGNPCCIKFTSAAGSGTLTLGGGSIQFDPTTDHVIYVNSANSSFTTGGARYYSLSDMQSGTGTEANAQVKFQVAGTLSKMEVYVHTNASTTNCAGKLRVNGADGGGGVAVSVTASTTGLFQDATNTQSVSATDLINFYGDQATTGLAEWSN